MGERPARGRIARTRPPWARPTVLLLAALLAGGATPAAAGPVADAVAKRGVVRCGVGPDFPGFYSRDAQGQWTGLDIELCRAVAAAVLGDAHKAQLVPLLVRDRFPALKSGEIDVLLHNPTWTLSRDTDMGVGFTAIYYYDRQAVMVPKALGVTGVQELDGAKICVRSDTTTINNLADYFRARRLRYTPLVDTNGTNAATVFENGQCDALTADAAQLAAIRSRAATPDDYVILPETLAKEPIAAAVADGDQQWFTMVKWVIFALVEAEEMGLTAATIDDAAAGPDAALRRFAGTGGDIGSGIGLPNRWAYQAVKQVGNYGEIYQRTVGHALGLPRGPNALWTKGGLFMAPPLR